MRPKFVVLLRYQIIFFQSFMTKRLSAISISSMTLLKTRISLYLFCRNIKAAILVF